MCRTQEYYRYCGSRPFAKTLCLFVCNEHTTIINRRVQSKCAPQKASPAITTMRQVTSAYSTQQATSAYNSIRVSDAGATGRGQKAPPPILDGIRMQAPPAVVKRAPPPRSNHKPKSPPNVTPLKAPPHQAALKAPPPKLTSQTNIKTPN